MEGGTAAGAGARAAARGCPFPNRDRRTRRATAPPALIQFPPPSATSLPSTLKPFSETEHVKIQKTCETWTGGREKSSQVNVSPVSPLTVGTGPIGDPTEQGERLNSDTSDDYWTAVVVLKEAPSASKGDARRMQESGVFRSSEGAGQGADCLFGCHGVGDFGNHRIPTEISILSQ